MNTENIRRILICNTTMDRGGAETFIMNLYRAVDKSKIQFDFILNCNYESAYEKEILALGGKIYKLPVYKLFNHFSFKKKYRNFFKNHPQYNLIYGHNINSAAVYLKTASKEKLHTVSHCHCTTNGKGLNAKIRDFVRRNLYRIAEYRFACSEEAGKWAYREKAPFKVINNGIDCAKFAFNLQARNSIRNFYKIPENAFVLGHVGRLQEEKNHSFLLEVFTAFHKKKPDSYLMLVGSGNLEEQIKNKAKALGIEKQLIMTGVRTDVENCLSAMDAFVFPSLFEGLPLTLVEAQCSGLTCFVSDIITESVNLTNLFKKISLNESAEIWAEKIYASKERQGYPQAIKKAGFDIFDIAENLQSFLLKLSASKKQ